MSGDSNRTVIVGSVVALIVVIGVGALLYLFAGPVVPGTDGAGTPEPPVAEAPPPEPDGPPEEEVVRRVPIPRPTRAAPDAPEVEDQPGEPDTDALEEALDSDLPRLVRGGPELGEELNRVMGEYQSELVECLAGWHELQPDVFEGEVTFGLGMDRDGMHTIDVLDVENVPEQTLTCLGDVLWDEVDWPGVEEPLEVSWPIQVSVREEDGE